MVEDDDAGSDGAAEDVELFPPHIDGPIAAWRALHPLADAACIKGRVCLTEDDALALAPLRNLDVSACSSLSDAHLAHLCRVERLILLDCSQNAITDTGLSLLVNVRSLCLERCNQYTITGACFQQLTLLQQLSIRDCDQLTISSTAFAHLHGLRKIDRSGCRLG